MTEYSSEAQQSMSPLWPVRASDLPAWPGSRWWRCDLHVHSFASHDSTASASDIIDNAVRAGLDAIAITDHNTGQAIDEFQALGDLPVAVFPGVELTTSEGAHLIVLFDRDATTATVTTFLGRCSVPAEDQGTKAARSPRSYEQCLDIADDCRGVCIAPHADLVTPDGGPASSLLEVLQRGNGLRAVLDSEHLHAVELRQDNDDDRFKLCFSPDRKVERRPWLRGSDAHIATDVGRASTWIKMTTPTLEGLRLAFADGARSLQPDDGHDPNQSRPTQWIERIEISRAKLLGRHQPFSIELNPWLNAIIGGRSTGKSSVIEMIRLGLERGGDLPTDLEAEWKSFATIGSGDGPGMLLSDTTVVVTYRKDGARFRVTWNEQRTAIEQQDDAGLWEPVEGEVAQRFPVRVFSQKQVFALAEGSDALLRVIDVAPEVGWSAWNEQHEELRARYLSERAEARAIETRLADRGRLQGKLDDAERKLRVFEESNHSAILREFSRRQQQNAALTEFDAGLSAAAKLLRDTAPHITAELASDAFGSRQPDDDAILAAASAEQTWLADIRRQVLALAAQVDARRTNWLSSEPRKAWQRSMTEATATHHQLEATLHQEGAGAPGEYAALLREKQDLDAKLRGLQAESDELSAAVHRADETLRGLLALRRQLTQRRTDFISSVLDGNGLVQIDVVPYGSRGSAEASLRHILGTNSFSNDIVGDAERPGLITTLYPNSERTETRDMEERLTEARRHLSGLARGNLPVQGVRDQRFAAHVAQLTGEAKDLLSMWTPADAVRVRVSRRGEGRRFLPVEQASPGSKSAGMLAFLLAHGSDPIVLDQPEDDLDNRLINDVVVEQLRDSKATRQLIVVTHNPNIVVNGDAEYIASMDLPDQLGQIVIRTEGGLQETDVRDEICAVMEGGRTAFEQRYRRIAGWRGSS
jgi:hypothetical protein